MRSLIFIISLFALTPSWGQLIAVTDTALANVLCEQVPSTMSAGCDTLDTGGAQNYNGELDFSNRPVRDVSVIVHYNRVDTLKFANCGLTEFLDEIRSDVFWSLKRIDLSGNELDTFPRFSVNVNYPYLDHFWLQNNKATSIQRFWSLRDSIVVLNVAGNLLSEVEDYSRCLKATLIDISNNRLTFEDIVPQTAHPDFANIFTVAPQADVPWENPDSTVVEQTAFSLDLGIDQGVTTNRYDWYKNGLFLETTTGPLEFASVSFEDAGKYTVKVWNTNSLLDGVELKSEDFMLSVVDCFDPQLLAFDWVSHCEGVADLFVDTASLEGVDPFQFTVLDGVSEIEALDGIYTLKEGFYTLSLEDGNGCIKEYGEIEVVAKADCDEFVLTPDGDGVQDTYYFESEGSAKIIDLSGMVLRELDLPGFWDATDRNGQVLSPGKYLLQVGDNPPEEIKIIW